MYSEIVKEYLDKDVFIRTKSGLNLHVHLLSVSSEVCRYVIPSYKNDNYTVPERFGHVNTQDIEAITDLKDTEILQK